jgi:hypothetical protein
MGEAFFFCGCYDLSVFDQASRWVMEGGVDS